MHPVEHFFVTDTTSRTHEETWDEFLAEVGKSGKVLFASHVVRPIVLNTLDTKLGQ